MDPVSASAIIGAGSKLISGFFGHNSAKKAAAQQFEYQKALQQQNIDWEREQLQNKNQWTVNDMKAAGLNPILAAGNVNSATSSGVGSVSLPDTKMDLALDYSALRKNNLEADAAKDNANSEARNADSNAKNADTNARNIDALIEKNKHDMDLADKTTAAQIAKLVADIENTTLESKARAGYYYSAASSVDRQSEAAFLTALSHSAVGRQYIEKMQSEVKELEQRLNIRKPDEKNSESMLGYWDDMPTSMRTIGYVGNLVRSVFPFFRSGY